MNTFAEKLEIFKRWVHSGLKAIVHKLLAIFLTYIYLAFLPFFLFVLYMWERNFFAYDFFSEGFVPLGIFHNVTIIAVVVLSLFFFSSLIPLIFLGNGICDLVTRANKTWREATITILKDHKIAAVLSLFLLTINITSLWTIQATQLYTVLIILGFFIVLHISSLAFLEWKFHSRTIVLLILATLCVFTFATEQAARTLG